ncbi:MAG: flagellar basal body-associated FliL family protein [Acidimicrobiales bacterium]
MTATTSSNAPVGAKARPKRKRLLLVVIVVVVLVAAGVAYKMFFGHHRHHQPRPGVAFSLPRMTINLTGGHLLQVQLGVQLVAGVKQKALPAGATDKMENDEIKVLSGFTYQSLLTGVGKAKAKADLLAAFRTDGGKGHNGPAVLAVYYTGLVMQ